MIYWFWSFNLCNNNDSLSKLDLGDVILYIIHPWLDILPKHNNNASK